MRISDWSSDVCSADLVTPFSIRVPRTFCEQTENTKWNSSNRGSTVASRRRRLGVCRSGLIRVDCSGLITRSEEHTSELQSLMRTSYAVFCVKKHNSTKYVTYAYTQTLPADNTISYYYELLKRTTS